LTARTRRRHKGRTVVVLRAFSIWGAAALAAAAMVDPGVACAERVTYRVFAITDVKLGQRVYHNAEVQLEFVGDSTDVQPFQAGPNSGFFISRGEARIRITHSEETLSARFLPGQIMVAADNIGGGAGFSSLVGSDHHLEAAYPLAVDGGTVSNYNIDLVTTAAYSGKAWSCIGFPIKGRVGGCGDPAPYPLKTDKGDLFVYQTYLGFNADGSLLDDYMGSLNNGFFSVTTGDAH